MHCPNCQTMNPPSAKFCLECGNRLLVCANCGTANPPQAKFCMECGTALVPGQPASNTPPVPAQPLPLTTPMPLQPVPTPAPIAAAYTNPSPLPIVPVPPEERRVVTVMFADITGSTPLADRLDPEDMRAILTGYFNLMAEQIRKHGGTVEKYIGDAVMAVFGLPITHEDDPDRAIRAALDMQSALARFNAQRQAHDTAATRLQMRIGINTGEVAAPTNASPQGQDFLVTGDAVNIAARLQQMAAPDTILVGERTYLSTRGAFAFRPIAPLSVKGKPEPITAYVVQRPQTGELITQQQPRGIEGHESPLVGRTLELTLLHASYARVQAERRPHLITILGVPGVGKSRLVREFIAREQERMKSASATGGRVAPLVLKGRCLPYGEGITYWPLVEILRTLLQVQDNEDNLSLQRRFTDFVKQTLVRAGRNEDAEEIALALLRHIGHSLSKQAGPTGSTGNDERLMAERETPTRQADPKQNEARSTLLRAWRVLIEALAERQPLVIVVDDLQWADEALLDLLKHLTERITTTPVLFLCPARPEFLEQHRDWGGGHRNITTIELEALSWDESSELVDALLNCDDLPDTLRYTILSRAEGNPFFVEEIIRMLIDQDILVQSSDPVSGKTCWRVNNSQDTLLGRLSTPGEPPEDTLLEKHYVLNLPHVPDTVQGVLAARIDLLHPTEKLLLQYAAIVGRTFWLSALLALAEGLDATTVLDALVSLLRRDFIVETDKQASRITENDRVFHFKHILIHDVVYNNIPRQRRSREHARLALWLEGKTEHQRGPFLELLAHHYQQALTSWSNSSPVDTIDIKPENGDPAVCLTRAELRQRTIHYLTMAGDQALHSYYTLRAIRAYNDVLDLLREEKADEFTRSKMHKKLGDAYAQRINLEEAWQHYRKALQLVTQNAQEPDLENCGDCRYLLVLYEHLALLAMRWLGHFDTPPDMQEVRGYIDAGLRLLEGKPLSREHVVFHTYETLWYIRQLQDAPNDQKTTLVELALTSGRRALSQAEELNEPHTLSMTLDANSFAYEKYHRYDKAMMLQGRRLQLEQQLTERAELFDLYFSLGCIATEVADFPQALSYLGRSWSIAQTMESPTMLRSSLTKRMCAWDEWNRWDEAEQTAHQILHLIEKYQLDERRQFWPLETLARIAYYRGDQEGGDRYARRCKRLMDLHAEQVSLQSRKSILLRMRLIYYACGNLERAVSDFQDLLELTEPLPSPQTLATLADLLTQVQAQQDDEHLAEICERAIAMGELSGVRKSLLVALRSRGRLYTLRLHWEQAEQDLQHALQLCQEIDLPWEQGHTLYALGQLYNLRAINSEGRDQRIVDRERARHHLERALGFYESLRAAPMAEQTRKMLRLLHTTSSQTDGTKLVSSPGD